jgi:hypothetical protein
MFFYEHLESINNRVEVDVMDSSKTCAQVLHRWDIEIYWR